MEIFNKLNKIDTLASLGTMLWSIPMSGIITFIATYIGYNKIDPYWLILGGLVIFYISFNLIFKFLEYLSYPSTFLDYQTKMQGGQGNPDLMKKGNIFGVPKLYFTSDVHTIEFIVLFEKPLKRDFKIRIDKISGELPILVGSEHNERFAKFAVKFPQHECIFKILFEQF